jgi:D-tagatose-1,6-bisphosphate aldolase subunit GatZ/KbaZ
VKTHPALHAFLKITKQNRDNQARGIYSVCSAHPDVLEAAIRQARSDNSIVLVEATSNQVNQFGGYTGMKPDGFAAFVFELARRNHFPTGNVLLGGDHLGPNPWQQLSAEEAMQHAEELVHQYVKAGFRKIHLDTSMPCGTDVCAPDVPMPDEIVAARSARLCHVAEETWRNQNDASPGPVYCIGTEVPIPGGAQKQGHHVVPTRPEQASATIEITENLFRKESLEAAWDRVVGLVVQPGVEFGDDTVHPYQAETAEALSKRILNYTHLVFEAHSTDYQTETCLKALVKDHFAILKVGPWLTFALREALFALESIERELIKDRSRLSDLRNTLEKTMLENPRYWTSYYSGTESAQRFKCCFSFSDRARYYWPLPGLQQSVACLYENLRQTEVPRSLLSQYLPDRFYSHDSSKPPEDPRNLVIGHIQHVTALYARACGYGGV